MICSLDRAGCNACRRPRDELCGMQHIHAFVLLALLGSPATAQLTLTTYYMLPPTSGCNGLWAFGPASAVWQAPCTAPFLYVVEPLGCAEGAGIGQPFWISGDTVYSNLCSTPCSITIYDASGDCVILCQLPVNTGVTDGMRADTPELRIDPNPLASGTPLKITTQSDGPVELTLTDALGRVVYQGLITSNTGVISTAQLGAGLHMLRARLKDGHTRTQRLLVE